MKLVKAAEMQDIDRRAASEYGILSLVLMENAGIRTAEMVPEMLGSAAGKKVIILAGRGNNGGDGLVAARHLHNSAAEPVIFLMGKVGQLSPDSKVNYDILQKMTDRIYPLTEDSQREKLSLELLDADIIIDAIYGIGFKGSLNAFETDIVQLINKTKAPVIAVDIPSGVEADSGKVNGEAVKAAATVTFALPKPGLILEPGKNHTGKLKIADISIPAALLQDKRLKTDLITEDMVAGMLGPRNPDAHKGTFGHALLIGGSTGLSGAILLAARGAIKCGAGLVSAALPVSLVPIFDTALQEVMSIPLTQTSQGAISIEALPAIENILGTSSVCAVGPGMSRYQEAHAIIRFILERAGGPVVIDADGLNALAGDVSILKERQVPVVLTPHPGEMARLTGKTIEEIQADRIDCAAHYAREWGAVIVLKGNKTVIAAPKGEIYVNITGNPGMATAGSGDVLCGIITGLISQGLKPEAAAAAGVYLHGLSGDHVAGTKGQRGLIAGDLLEALPLVMARFEKVS
ncbi:MAG TPA: NAD(P)H-hydrate dehydratase [Syntrophomonadaceae bacterium]|nr:NAD(P)H-hydrate dehydratase [Syntrophomonadaceae bacterium]HPR94491.1 NAD(P)H-hydrate dehydratase [Syntrophomonadaceae bacterium]